MRRLAFLVTALVAACTPTVAAPVGVGEQQFAVEVASVGMQTTGVTKVEVIGGDEAGLRTFIERYLQGFYPTADSVETRVWIGRLPDAPRVEVPLPEGARVISSTEGPYFALELILDVDQPVEAIRRWYAEALAREGWSPAPHPSGGGFVAETFELDSYCRTSDDAYLTVTARQVPERAADVRVNAMLPPDFTPCDSAYASPGDMGLFDVVPALRAPPGAVLRGGGGGSGDGYADATASLQTSASPAELLDHFDAQLRDAGWQPVASGSDEGIAWSTWSLPAEEGRTRHGLLVLLEMPLSPPEGEVFAMLRVVETR